MLNVLGHKLFGRLFAAQVIALLGTGLLTVALGLLAFDLAGDKAGAVLGTAYAIKMIAYVGLAPVASAIAARLPRKAILVGADLVRAGVAVFLPFIDAIWQIYVLIFVLQAASATFTPAFQAVIPDILDDEKDYTNALSLSRLAYDLENLLSPALAAVLLIFMSYSWLFGGTVIGFVGSGILVMMTAVPNRKAPGRERPFIKELTRGTGIFLATPRLRGLLALNLAAAAAGAFVLVNTVVIVLGEYGATETEVAYALAAFGGGSMLTALLLPRLLETLPDRPIMVYSAFVLAGLILAQGVYITVYGRPPWVAFLVAWSITGMLYSAILTPSGRLLRISAHAEDRPAIFSAQFALSHACWLVTYPVAGWIGEAYGLPAAMLTLGGLAMAGAGWAVLVWPANEPKEISHEHPDLPPDHPLFKKYPITGPRQRHSHAVVIDDEHRVWPTQG
jgi:MFS family permease